MRNINLPASIFDFFERNFVQPLTQTLFMTKKKDKKNEAEKISCSTGFRTVQVQQISAWLISLYLCTCREEDLKSRRKLSCSESQTKINLRRQEKKQ